MRAACSSKRLARQRERRVRCVRSSCESRARRGQHVRDLELKAGYKAARGQRGAAHAYNIKSHRDQERRWVGKPRRPTRASSPVESAWSQAGAQGRHNRGATLKAARQGLRLAPLLSPRGHPCTRGNSADPARKHLSITSVVCGLLVLVREWSISSSAGSSSYRGARGCRNIPWAAIGQRFERASPPLAS